jgi:hypothetical protein
MGTSKAIGPGRRNAAPLWAGFAPSGEIPFGSVRRRRFGICHSGTTGHPATRYPTTNTVQAPWNRRNAALTRLQPARCHIEPVARSRRPRTSGAGGAAEAGGAIGAEGSARHRGRLGPAPRKARPGTAEGSARHRGRLGPAPRKAQLGVAGGSAVPRKAQLSIARADGAFRSGPTRCWMVLGRDRVRGRTPIAISPMNKIALRLYPALIPRNIRHAGTVRHTRNSRPGHRRPDSRTARGKPPGRSGD